MTVTAEQSRRVLAVMEAAERVGGRRRSPGRTAVTTEAPVRWGFLGAGFVASRGVAPVVHAADGAVLQVVAARDLARAESLEPVRASTSYAEVCTSDDVDAVYLSLPNDAHLPWVLAALEAGKHVLCEKPLGLDAAQVATMTAAARDADRLLVEASWNRWHPRTRRVEAAARRRSTGRLEVDARGSPSPACPQDNYRLDPTRGGGALSTSAATRVAAALIGARRRRRGDRGREHVRADRRRPHHDGRRWPRARGAAPRHGLVRARRVAGLDRHRARVLARRPAPGLHLVARGLDADASSTTRAAHGGRSTPATPTCSWSRRCRRAIRGERRLGAAAVDLARRRTHPGRRTRRGHAHDRHDLPRPRRRHDRRSPAVLGSPCAGRRVRRARSCSCTASPRTRGCGTASPDASRPRATRWSPSTSAATACPRRRSTATTPRTAAATSPR